MGTANFGIAAWTGSSASTGTGCANIASSARARDEKTAFGAMLCMYDETCATFTGTLTPGWNRLKPACLRMLVRRRSSDSFEQGDLGFQIERHSPLDPQGERAFTPLPGSKARRAGVDPAGDQVHQGGVAGDEDTASPGRSRRRLHRHQHDRHLQGQQHQLGRRHDPDDGSARGEERDEQECFRIVGAIGDATHWNA